MAAVVDLVLHALVGKLKLEWQMCSCHTEVERCIGALIIRHSNGGLAITLLVALLIQLRPLFPQRPPLSAISARSLLICCPSIISQRISQPINGGTLL